MMESGKIVGMLKAGEFLRGAGGVDGNAQHEPDYFKDWSLNKQPFFTVK